MKQFMKQWIKKYGHIWLLSYAFLYLPWFCHLERTIRKYHVIHTRLDDFIPFSEYFIIPYLLWFLYVGAAIFWFFLHDRDGYYRLCTYLFTGMTIALLICTLYPNGTNFRPAVDPDKNIFSWLVVRLWGVDTPTNVFPSIHVYNSVCVHIAVCKSPLLKKNRKLVIASGILMTAICLATVFLKQHSVIDGCGAILMAACIYPLAYAPVPDKRKKLSREIIR